MIQNPTVRAPLGRDDVSAVLDQLAVSARIAERRATGMTKARAAELIAAIDTGRGGAR